MNKDLRPELLRKADINIITAAREGNIDVLKRLVHDVGVATDFQESEGSSTPLMTAAIGGFVDILQFLLNPGPGIASANINKQDREHRTALINAVLNNRVDCVALLMEYGADPNLYSRNGWTPLYIAANKGYTDIAKILLYEYGSNSPMKGTSYHTLNVNMAIQNTVGGTVLMIACMQGHYEIVQSLLESGADVNVKDKQNWTALMKAAEKGHDDIVKLLLAYNADAEVSDNAGLTALMLAAKAGRMGVVNILAQQHGVKLDSADKDGRTALVYAAVKNNHDVVQFLLAGGADVNARDTPIRTTLMTAAERGHIEAVKLLLEYGADALISDDRGCNALMLAVRANKVEAVKAFLQQRGSDLHAVDKNGSTAIAHAAVGNFHVIVKMLLEGGADVNVRDKTNWTALMHAAKKGYVEVVETLLTHGADTQTSDNEGFNALMLASKAGKMRVVKALVRQRNGDLHSVDKEGKTALAHAVENDHHAVARFLCMQGADINHIDQRGRTLLSLARSPAMVELLAFDYSSVHIVETTSTALANELEYSQIPQYLHSSALYKSLDKDSGQITIPEDCFKHSDEVTNSADFALLLKVMQFWVLDTVPHGMCNYCVRHEISSWVAVLNDTLHHENAILKDLAYVFDSNFKFERAIEVDRTEFVEFFAALGPLTYVGAMTAAARFGRFDAMQLLWSRNYEWDATTCASAASAGHLTCLEFAHRNGCAWDYQVYCSSIAGDHRACLDYAHSNGLPWHVDVCIAAVRASSSFYLRLVRERGCPWDETVTQECAAGGHSLCLEYALEHGCPLNRYPACASAYEGGHDHCLQLVQDASVCATAASTDNVLFLEYLHTNECPWDELTTDTAGSNGCEDSLRYALLNNCPRSPSLVTRTVQSRSFECVKFLIEEQCLGFEEDGSVFGAAFERGDLDMMRYLVDVGCPFNNFVFLTDRRDLSLSQAEWDAQLQACIVYAMERGWVPNPEIYNYAATEHLPLCSFYLHTYQIS